MTFLEAGSDWHCLFFAGVGMIPPPRSTASLALGRGPIAANETARFWLAT
jgi:hypothetical protein